MVLLAVLNPVVRLAGRLLVRSDLVGRGVRRLGVVDRCGRLNCRSRDVMFDRSSNPPFRTFPTDTHRRRVSEDRSRRRHIRRRRGRRVRIGCLVLPGDFWMSSRCNSERERRIERFAGDSSEVRLGRSCFLTGAVRLESLKPVLHKSRRKFSSPVLLMCCRERSRLRGKT